MSTSSDRSPSFLASLGGYLRPGGVTAREGAAGTTLLAAVVLVGLGVLLSVLGARARSRIG